MDRREVIAQKLREAENELRAFQHMLEDLSNQHQRAWILGQIRDIKNILEFMREDRRIMEQENSNMEIAIAKLESGGKLKKN